MQVIDEFLEGGVASLGQIIDTNSCTNLMKQIKQLIPLNEDFFKDNIFLKKNEANPHQSNRTGGERGVHTKQGRNLTEQVNLDFIEKNPKLQQYLSKILGHDYKIMHKKFVLGVPRNFIPKWITKETDNVRIAGLNSYVKPEYRGITYFHGIDFHMDLLDHKNRIGDFITLYVYIQDVTPSMSPLFVVPKSHIFGALPFPYDVKILKKNKLSLGDGKGKSEILDFKMLTGAAGSAFFWSEYTLHGTQPTAETTVPRISLRYLIERGSSDEELPIDKLLKKVNGSLSIKSKDWKTFTKKKEFYTESPLKRLNSK